MYGNTSVHDINQLRVTDKGQDKYTIAIYHLKSQGN